ncbi:MAG: hypothetical protein ACI9T7_000039 [Oleiphilaceae bacterium]|jgi:hypothetical protein
MTSNTGRITSAHRIIDVIYNVADIESIDEIHTRGIGKDLVCHFIGNALAYKEGTKDSINPLDYVTYSGNVFEIGSINGFMDYIEDMDKPFFRNVTGMLLSMRDLTDEMMLAAELFSLKSFFEDNVGENEIVINHINIVFNSLPEMYRTRCEEIKIHVLATNSPQVRIKRMLKARDNSMSK